MFGSRRSTTKDPRLPDIRETSIHAINAFWKKEYESISNINKY